MANQPASIDQNQFPALIGHSGTAGTAETRKIVVTDAGAVKVDLVTGDVIEVSIGTINTQDEPYSVRVDDTGTGTVYVGEATTGSNEGSASWRIKRIVDNSGTVDIKWCDGTATLDNVWTNRGTLSYS